MRRNVCYCWNYANINYVQLQNLDHVTSRVLSFNICIVNSCLISTRYLVTLPLLHSRVRNIHIRETNKSNRVIYGTIVVCLLLRVL